MDLEATCTTRTEIPGKVGHNESRSPTHPRNSIDGMLVAGFGHTRIGIGIPTKGNREEIGGQREKAENW
jgi:hypothetical protein